MKEMNTVLIAIESDKSVVRKMELSWIMCKKGLYDEYECECVEIDPENIQTESNETSRVCEYWLFKN